MNWISVEERLPINNPEEMGDQLHICKEVIVFDGESVKSAEFHAGKTINFWCGFDKVKATHWMPLPAPPALCEICNGTGIIFIGCCSGNQCGCMGQPVAAKKCKCGKQIDESKMTNDEFFIFEHVEYLEDTP